MSNDTAASQYDQEIAIIGMAGRFPGARTVEAFWRNLCDGRDLITHLSDQELAAAGVAPELIQHPAYVKRGYLLDEADQFDAPFFGYTPREAEIIDPQHRVFLECAWEALEHAGYNPTNYAGLIAVYAGTNMTTYFLFNLSTNQELLEEVGLTQTRFANDKDYLATRVSYKLNLKGPSLTVQTACSTSLVAVHLACQSLLNGESDLALAGGVSIMHPQQEGYLYQEGGLLSPDGYCRAFDAEGRGTVFGNGAGIVVLKRMADALNDGDTIYAVIKGSAINNDGAHKVGYTAPSEVGQAEVITEALALARIDPATIGYVETHGTGTPLGDPIEIAALTAAFGAAGAASQTCALGAVKTNIGHLDAAAGVAGLIKAVLALRHGQIPPSLHYHTPNPRIDFANSPFFVNAALRDWPATEHPRRAGVSSFGIGGTNAHVVLEAAPPAPAPAPARPWQLLLLSAKSEAAAEAASTRLAAHLRQQPDACLADVAYTLQVGRQSFEHRRMLVCQSVDGALAALEGREGARVLSAVQPDQERPVVFMFPGGGAQYAQMGRDLYEAEPIFRAEVDRCLDILRAQAQLDLRPLLFPSAEQEEYASAQLRRTSLALPALFLIEYALGTLWMAWGIQPSALIGHSLGEYVAACFAGVIALEDALAMVTLRGQLFERLPAGAMLSVGLPEAELQPLLTSDLAIAAVNGPAQCVVSGPVETIEQLAKTLAERAIEARRVLIDVAAHSPMVTPILEPFITFVATLRLQAPRIPYISNVTGTWITAEETTDPRYWARHLRQTVRFNDGLDQLLSQPDQVFLEVGPGRALSAFVNTHPAKRASHVVVPSLRHPHTQISDVAFCLGSLGQLWLAGLQQIDWAAFQADSPRQRVALPTYAFQHERYWIAPQRSGARPDRRAGTRKRANLDDWFAVPVWKQSPPPSAAANEALAQQPQRWLIFADAGGLAAGLGERLSQAGQLVVTVEPGDGFEQRGPRRYAIQPGQRQDYATLLGALQAQDLLPSRVVHAWSLGAPDEPPATDAAGFVRAQALGFSSLVALAQTLGAERQPLQIVVLASGLAHITGSERLCPEKASLLGACRVIAQEYPQISCWSIDLSVPPAGSWQHQLLLDRLLAELAAPPDALGLAYRGSDRWVQQAEPRPLAEPDAVAPLREQGHYLIIGGLSGLGGLQATALALRAPVRLTLLEDQGAPTIATASQPLVALGAAVLTIPIDRTDEDQLRGAFAQAVAQHGPLHGVIYAEGHSVGEHFCGVAELGDDPTGWPSYRRLAGLYALQGVLREHTLDFCLLQSSLAAVLGGLGHAIEAASCCVIDAFAQQHNQTSPQPWISVGWDAWRPDSATAAAPRSTIDDLALTPADITAVLPRIAAASPATPLLISTGDLTARIAQWLQRTPQQAASQSQAGETAARHARPNVRTAYQAPTDDVEWVIAESWQRLLGIEQVGIHDNFFDLGGHSLLATQVIGRIGTTFKMELPIRALFEEPTVAALARALAAREPKPGQVAKIARAIRKIRASSEEEKRQTLEEMRKARGLA